MGGWISTGSQIKGLFKLLNDSDLGLIHTFSHATEIRADINAMLQGIEYTKGGIPFLKLLINCYGDAASFTHPSPSVRLKIAQDIEGMHRDQMQCSLISCT